MKLIEVKELKPLVWTLLEKLVGGDDAVAVNIEYKDEPLVGRIYSTQPMRKSSGSSMDGKPVMLKSSLEDADALFVRYTHVDADGSRSMKMGSVKMSAFVLGMDADERYTIKRADDGIMTLVNV